MYKARFFSRAGNLMQQVKFHCVAGGGEVDRAGKLLDKTGRVMIFDNVEERMVDFDNVVVTRHKTYAQLRNNMFVDSNLATGQKE